MRTRNIAKDRILFGLPDLVEARLHVYCLMILVTIYL